MNIEYKSVNELILDPDNARFAELYSGSKKEEDLIMYLLYTEAAEEVATNISDKKQFYPDETLWVIPKGEKFLVKDGNRRCAAVKALQIPIKYGLSLPKMKINKLPVLVYKNPKELDQRIQEKHTRSLFREWDRIAKALKAFELYTSGSSEESMIEIDSDPPQLIKLANFYYKAVEIANEDFKKLLRRGKGKSGGKTIIFERLFSHNKLCGYKFKGKPSYEIEIINEETFEEYVTALVNYLKDHPETGHGDVDREKADFLKRLKKYGFVPGKISKSDKNKSRKTRFMRKRGSIKDRPKFARKQVAPKLKRVIDECYNLNDEGFANAKIALSRVVFESVLKYVVEETNYKKKKLKNYPHFRSAFYNQNGDQRKYTNFEELRKKFIELIKETGIKKAFEQFDLDRLHQTIHNYKSGAGPNDARTVTENLIPLIEFMLQTPDDFFASINIEKLT